jgi:putative lipase involved disintegration of autophagic bodies
MKKLFIVLFIVSILALSLSSCITIFPKRTAQFSPILKSIQEGEAFSPESLSAYRAWNVDEQKKLYFRTKQVVKFVPESLLTSNIDFKRYHDTKAHNRLKQKLRLFVNNTTAWPEYIYISRIVESGTKYQILCSTSDIIEEQALVSLVSYDINSNMQIAFTDKRPYVTDLFNAGGGGLSTHAAVYYPIFDKKKPIGILVFVKGYWTKRPIEDRVLMLEQKVRLLEYQVEQLKHKQ